jgi:hypothetical protein
VKNAFVVDNLELLGGSNLWNVSFTRKAHDWSLDIFASFLFSMYCIQLK